MENAEGRTLEYGLFDYDHKSVNTANLNKSALQFRIFDQRIKVLCEDELFRSLLLANFAAFQETEGSADMAYSVDRQPSGGFCIYRGKETLAEEKSDEEIQYNFVYLLEKLITIDLQTSRPDLYFVHSSALEHHGRAIMIAADSGTGKSTTTWALLQHGFNYLSDELAPIDPGNLDIHPYPHALCLKSTPPGPYPLPEDTVKTERTMHIPVNALLNSPIKDPKPLGAILFLRRDSERSAPTYAEVSPAEAGARLYANTLNALAHPGSGLDVAIKIAGAVPAFTLDAGELQATCELISKLADSI
ncbi:hypothetical protein ACFL3A_07610 [Pseudomonadota bacterium]